MIWKKSDCPNVWIGLLKCFMKLKQILFESNKVTFGEKEYFMLWLFVHLNRNTDKKVTALWFDIPGITQTSDIKSGYVEKTM